MARLAAMVAGGMLAVALGRWCCVYVWVCMAHTLPWEEAEAVYTILEAANAEVDWKAAYPDDLCMAGPHGIVCEADDNAEGEGEGEWHVVGLSVGWLSEYSSNPACSANATMSSALVRLRWLRRLSFYGCFTAAPTRIPGRLWDMGSTLTELVLHGNPALRGALQPGVERLLKLRRLIVVDTGVGGAIPDGVGTLRQLQQLVLSGNKLASTVPPSLGNCNALVVLDLSRNNLSGPLPAELGRLRGLLKLDVSDNSLSGAPPPALCGLQNLEMMDLSRNNFSGGIPRFLFQIAALKVAELSDNPLGGFIPDLWERLPQLQGLGLSRARLSGRVPGSMAHMQQLRWLSLDHNPALKGGPSRLPLRFPAKRQLCAGYTRRCCKTGVPIDFGFRFGFHSSAPISVTSAGYRFSVLLCLVFLGKWII